MRRSKSLTSVLFFPYDWKTIDALIIRWQDGFTVYLTTARSSVYMLPENKEKHNVHNLHIPVRHVRFTFCVLNFWSEIVEASMIFQFPLLGLSSEF